MKNIGKIALVVSKIVEILHWIGAAAAGVLFVCTFAAGSRIISLWDKGVLSESDNAATTYGFEIDILDGAGNLNLKAVALFSICAVVTLSLFAMIFRNLYLIIKNSGKNPFSADNIRRLKEIGIFSIASPIICFFISVISRIVLGAGDGEIAVGMEGFITGILVLFLTQIFTYGAQLQKDVDGLL